MWRRRHKILTAVIAAGGVLGTWMMISLGAFRLLWFLGDFLPEYPSPLYQIRVYGSFGLGLVVTAIIWGEVHRVMQRKTARYEIDALRLGLQYALRDLRKNKLPKEFNFEAFCGKTEEKIEAVRHLIFEADSAKPNLYGIVPRMEEIQELYDHLDKIMEEGRRGNDTL